LFRPLEGGLGLGGRGREADEGAGDEGRQEETGVLCHVQCSADGRLVSLRRFRIGSQDLQAIVIVLFRRKTLFRQ
jgi:hypothetical protein